MNAAPPLLRLHSLTASYERHPAVHHVSGEIAAGSLTAIVGPNGAGKSTLLKALVGLAPQVEGRIEFVAKPKARTRVAYLPQIADIDRSFPISTFDTVLLGRWSTLGGFAGAGKADLAEARRAISAVGLEGFERRPISTLSAGQFQRALFARLLLQDADLILLDEPFNAVDARTVADLLALIRRWREDKRTVLCVLHDFEQVRAHFPETLLLAREVVAWGPTSEILSAANLLRARAMAEAWDEFAAPCERAA
jgi:zinc/manganese transport system ATP-binding protein